MLTDHDPRHLAEKVSLVLSRPRPDIEASLRSRASVSRFSWANVAEAIVREFRLVVAEYLAAVS